MFFLSCSGECHRRQESSCTAFLTIGRKDTRIFDKYEYQIYFNKKGEVWGLFTLFFTVFLILPDTKQVT
jgi:hypothetical protein